MMPAMFLYSTPCASMVSRRVWNIFFVREAGLGGICPLVIVCVGPGSLENVGVEISDPVLERGLTADHLRSEGASVERAFKGYDDLLCRTTDHLAVGACDLDCRLNCLGAGREHERLAVGGWGLRCKLPLRPQRAPWSGADMRTAGACREFSLIASMISGLPWPAFVIITPEEKSMNLLPYGSHTL